MLTHLHSKNRERKKRKQKENKRKMKEWVRIDCFILVGYEVEWSDFANFALMFRMFRSVSLFVRARSGVHVVDVVGLTVAVAMAAM